MIEIVLSWPPAELFPNQANRRFGHYGYARRARDYRMFAWGLTAQQLGPRLRKYEAAGDIVLHTEITPPMRRGKPADEDGIMAALKSARDGIASALGVDDKLFRHAQPVWHEREGNGKVIISF